MVPQCLAVPSRTGLVVLPRLFAVSARRQTALGIAALFCILIAGTRPAFGACTSSLVSLPDNPNNICCTVPDGNYPGASLFMEVDSVSKCMAVGRTGCDGYENAYVAAHPEMLTSCSYTQTIVHAPYSLGNISGQGATFVYTCTYNPSWPNPTSGPTGTGWCGIDWHGFPLYIRITPALTAPQSSTFITSVEPGAVNGPNTNDTAILVAKAYDRNNQPVADVAIELKTDVLANSGGHQHDDSSRHANYAGTLSPVGGANGTVSDGGKTLTGNTVTSGLLFRFTGPAFPGNPAGNHTVTARCTDRLCKQQGPNQMWVGVRDLVEIPASTSLAPWNLIGETVTHPKNHYLTGGATLKLIALASYYHAMFPNDPPLQLNDASLERGGLFDLYPDKPAWQSPHFEHRRGVVIDIQANGAANAIPERNFEAFKLLMRRLGMGWDPELLNQSNGHFHVRLLGVAQ